MISLSVLKNLLNNSKRGIIRLSKLLRKIEGFAVNNETISEEETSLDRKNCNFGKITLWGCDESNQGAFLMMMSISECEKPWFLKKVMTESGLSGVLKRTSLLLKYLRADSCVKPKLLMRYDTANGRVIDSD